MKIGWIGVHAEGMSALKAVCEAEYDVIGLMTLDQQKADRRCGSASYESICERFQIPMFEVDHVNAMTSVEILRNWNCDVLVVLGWGQILDATVLQQARVGVVGAHASLLPHNRGSAPVNWAIIRNEEQTGNSLMWLGEGVDSGNIIAQRSFPITPYDTCSTIYEQVADSNCDMILELLLNLEAGNRPGKPQIESGEPVLPRRRPRDGVIHWNNTSRDIYNLIRALTRPYPGAFAYLNGQTYRIWNAALMPSFHSIAKPGTIMGPVMSPEENACGIMVATANGAVTILDIEDESGHVLRGRDLSDLCEQNWNGRRLSNAA